jgi:hypothetical protein
VPTEYFLNKLQVSTSEVKTPSSPLLNADLKKAYIFTSSSLCIFMPGTQLYRNVVVKWLTLMLRIREFPGSNLGPKTGYSDRAFVLSSVPLAKCRDSTLN